MSTLRQGAKALVLCVAAMGIAGCGESLVCQSEVLVAISEPSAIVAADLNATEDGVQTDVRVQSTFDRGVTLTLTVEDDAGLVLSELTTTTDSQGNAVFENVTVPPEGADLRVFGSAGQCGMDEDLRHVTVTVGADCELELATAPIPNDFYAPLDVYTASADGNAQVDGYQGDVIVHAPAGHTVVLFVSSPGDVEMEAGSGTANDSGEVRLAISLPEGQDTVRAECEGPGGAGRRTSPLTTVYVDTVAPTCALTGPVPGTSITPSLDADQDLDNGIQLALTGRADGDDVTGEPAAFVITEPGGATNTMAGTVLDAGGLSTTDASFDPDTTPADFGVAFTTRDHAGNPCDADETYRVVYAGCPIVVTAPVTTVTTDADGNDANGAQVDLVLDVDDECIGRPITTDCGSNDVGGAVGAGGAATLRADVCDGVPCESSELCTARVTSADGIETTAGIMLVFDNQAPNVAVQVSQPSGIACGGVVTPEQDVDGTIAGVQIRVRVVSPSAADRSLRLTNSAGTSTVPANGAGGEVLVTIENGGNDFAGIASDSVGNTATSATCRVSLADIAVTFTGAAADGTVGSTDGTVAGGNLTFDLTGTVSVAGASVTITVDGGPPQAAVVSGGTWSLSLVLAARVQPYALVAVATSGARTGTASLALAVDLSGPGTISDLVANADTRQSIRIAFTAPSDGGGAVAGYRVRYAAVALTDANFDTTGAAFSTGAPGAPGTAETFRLFPLRTGTAYWIGVASVDGAGNRSVAQIVGPITPRFDQSAVYGAPNTAGDAGFGLAMVRGRFNNDTFDDVAISSPFVTSGGLLAAGEVYVYLGSATGLAAAPSVTIRGITSSGNLGAALARVRWSSSSHDDLVISEPFGDGGSGAIYAFDGGAAFPTGTVDASTAPRRILSSTSGNWFSGSALGWQLATADHDGDGTDDLVTTAIFGGGGTAGAVVVFYGGTVPTGTVRISDVSAAGSGTAVIRMYEQVGPNLFGYYLHNLGPTQGATDAADDVAAGFAEDGVAGGELIVLRAANGRPASPGVTREPFTIGRDVRVRFNTIDTQLEWGSTVGSIEDQNGDGARELVIGDFRNSGDVGVVYVVDGDTVGIAGTSTVPGTDVFAHIEANTVSDQFGMAVLNNANADASEGDVDRDGFEDLVIASRATGTTQATLQVWFGPLSPGTEFPPAPDHVITGPASFQAVRPNIGGTPITAIWAGDVNADGLPDICWADWTSASRDGGFQVLWDDGT